MSDDLVLKRDDLRDIPTPHVPDGYAIRHYTRGDEEAWIEIHQIADRFNEITRDLYWSQFGSDFRTIRQRQLYAVSKCGRAVGTVSAWFPEPEVDPALGRLHWLAVEPSEQRKGLGTALVLATLALLRELGYQGAYLTTSSRREEALHLYEACGFHRAAPSEMRRPEIQRTRSV